MTGKSLEYLALLAVWYVFVLVFGVTVASWILLCISIVGIITIGIEEEEDKPDKVISWLVFGVILYNTWSVQVLFWSLVAVELIGSAILWKKKIQ